MRFAIDIWTEGPEDIEAYKDSGMLGCPDDSIEFDTLAEAWVNWIEPRRAFYMQLVHYPNYDIDEYGDGDILAEGRTDDFVMLMGLGLDDGLEYGEWLSEESE